MNLNIIPLQDPLQNVWKISSYLVVYPLKRRVSSFKFKGNRFQVCLNINVGDTFCRTVTGKNYKNIHEFNSSNKYLESLKCQTTLNNFFFSIWVFFHEHSQFTGQQGKWGVGMWVGGYLFNSSLPLPPASQTLRH